MCLPSGLSVLFASVKGPKAGVVRGLEIEIGSYRAVPILDETATQDERAAPL